MRRQEIENLAKLNDEGTMSDNESVVDLVLSAVQNVVDTHGAAFDLTRRGQAETFKASLVDLLSAREARANRKLVKWFSDRGINA